MPSVSKKQAKLMAAVAHNPKFAKKVGIPQKVGRDFNNADQRKKKFGMGGYNRGGVAQDPLGRADSLLRSSTAPLMQMRSYYAEGGKASGIKSAVLSLKEAISRLGQGDHRSAIQALEQSDLKDHPQVKKTLNALKLLDEVEED